MELVCLLLVFRLHLDKLGLQVLELLQGGMLLSLSYIKVALLGGQFLLCLALLTEDGLLVLLHFRDELLGLALLELFLLNLGAEDSHFIVGRLCLMSELLDC